MKTKVWLTLAAGLMALAPVGVLANLNPGDIQFNPESGSLPEYSTVAPSWINPANLAATLTGTMVGDFNGNVVSNVYYIAGPGDVSGGLGFTYQFNVDSVDGSGSTGLVRASHADAGWANFEITEAGSDGSGFSSSPGGAMTWTDGDPYFIERSAGSASPAIQWRFGSNGTQLLGGDQSAVIFFATNATDWEESHTDLLDSGLSAQAAILAPVPAPAGLLLGSIGLGCLALVKRRLA